MTVETHYPLSENDTRRFLEVSANDNRGVAANFKAKEFFNSSNGLESHPIAQEVIDAVQYIRSLKGVPIRITSTYRNFVPSGGAKVSAHMMAQAVDFQFAVEQEVRDTIMIELREDFDKKGPIFQELVTRFGVSGVGMYDSFVHLDVVQPELYEAFARKRKANYQGRTYAYWNSMKTLRYKKPKTKIVQTPTPTGEMTTTIEPIKERATPITLPEKVIEQVQETATEVAGSVRGTLHDWNATEDGYRGYTAKNNAYLAGLFILIIAAAWAAFLINATNNDIKR